MAQSSRRHRLSGAGAFETVLRGGRRCHGEFLEIIAMTAARDYGRFGMVIGRKVLRRAVDRNRVRRTLRVVLLRSADVVDGYDLIVRLKRPAKRERFPLIVAELTQLLARVELWQRRP